MKLITKKKQREILLRMAALGIILYDCADITDPKQKEALEKATDYLVEILDAVGGYTGTMAVLNALIERCEEMEVDHGKKENAMRVVR